MPSEDQIKSAVRFAAASNNQRALSAMINLAKSEPGIAVSPDAFDRDPWLFNVANGTLDLRTGELRPHNREDLITKLAPVDYDPSAQCPLWMAMLDRIFAGDSSLIGFVRRLFGYCLTGETSEQMLVIFHGGGANGKSTMLQAVLSILGDYGYKSSEGLLIDKRENEHPTAIAALAGRRLVVTSETKEDAKLAEARIKDMTGSETMTARRMREDFWQFIPTHKLILSTNYKPIVRGTDFAIWRRLKLVPFNVTIPPEEQDKQLPEKLKAEYAGILAWMIRGCTEWQQQGLGTPPQVEQATSAYRASEDAFGQFLNERCEVGAELTSGASELLDAYKQFSGDKQMSVRAFSRLLLDRGFASRRMSSGPNRGCKTWDGVSVKREA